jgi:nicotinamidase/pyrazinamidase
VLATRDWHPRRTRHFLDYGGAWPAHCVQGSPGAEFHPKLQLPEGTRVVSKGIHPEEDGYSAFEAVAEDGRRLGEILEALGVRRLLIGGLATDYCVRASTLDALGAGLEVTVLADAVAGVDVNPGDSARAVDEMERAGARFRRVDELV